MQRLKKPWFMFLVGQLSIVALIWIMINGTPTGAQKPTPATSPVSGQYEVFPSRPDGTSDTIGELPPEKPGHSYLSVTSAGFVPADSAYAYVNYGKGIINTDGTFQTYIRPVQLPQGAVVTGLTLIGGDVEPDTAGDRDTRMALSLIQSEIDRLDLSNPPFSEQEIALVLSNPNTPLVSDLGIYSAAPTADFTIDHTQYAYFLKVDLPTSNMVYRTARIEYLPPGNVDLPFVRKQP